MTFRPALLPRMTGRRRVVLATRIFRPEPAAAAFRLGALVDALLGDGVEVEVLTVRAPRALASLAEAEDGRLASVVRRWPVLRDANDYVRGYVPYLSFDLPLALRLLTTRRPDAFVVEPPPTTGAVVRVISWLRHVPYVAYLPDVWADGSSATDAPPLVVSVVRALERFVLRGAAAVVASTPEIAARATDLHGVAAQRVATVRNGIDTEVFTPDGPRAADAPDGPYAVYAGTTSEWQGADVLLRAWGEVLVRVPHASLVFLGHGSDRAELEALAAALPDRGASVHFVPLVPAHEAAAWQRAAAVALCTMRPGSGYDYFLPTKVFAAAACGTPTLYVGPGPARDLVSEQALGRAVRYDVDAVAATLAELLSAPAPADERARLARWVRENASVRRAGRGAADVVEKVIDERPRPGRTDGRAQIAPRERGMTL